MTTSPVAPRDERWVLARLVQSLPGYTPEWSPRESSAAYALMQAFAHLSGIVRDRLERMPERSLLACLDMVGTHLLPARAARVPLVFSVMSDAPLDVTLPAGSQVAAAPDPVAPSLEADAQPSAPAEARVFATERTVTLSRGRLACLYSIEPGADRYVDHSANIAGGFTLFDGMKLTPHHLYLGHDRLFALGGKIVLILSFLLQQNAKQPVSLAWEYHSEAGWVPLPYNLEDDTTGGLTANGQVKLTHEYGPNAKKAVIGGRESYWLRARLLTPLAPEAIAPPVIVNDIRARVEFGKEKLNLDAAFADAVSLDVSKEFYPFGQIPVQSSAFYLSCTEAFDRAGATVQIAFTLSRVGGAQSYTGSEPGGPFKLDWKFSTEGGWESLTDPGPSYMFASHETITFVCSPRWAKREVNGVKKRWLRVCISSGDFGRPPRVIGVTNKQPDFADGKLQPPMVKEVKVSFHYLTDPEPLDHCVVYNDFVFEDVTEAARWPDRRFVPFVPVSDQAPSVHLGLDRAPPDGLASLYVDVPEQEARSQAASPFVWEYRAADGWLELTVIDETRGFKQSGMIQFIGPQDAVAADGLAADGLSGKLYRLRARLKQGEAMLAAAVGGLWLNAVWAAEKRKIERELAGRSDGNPGQSFQLRRKPVLAGETVEVEEWTGRGEAWRSALADVPETAIRFERDPVSGAIASAWVRWEERVHFHESGPRDRHYAIERATGMLRLGSNVPSAGKRIAVSYASGGGVAGNVRAGTVKELRMAAPYVLGVTNPIPARGGADSETRGGVVSRGPRHLRHRDRGLSAQDLEWLALEASPEVARVRCLAVAGPEGTAQRGWVTLLVVPRSVDAQPSLSAELARSVFEHVAARAPAGMRIRVVGPQYVPVSVNCVVVPVDPTAAARVEARVRGALDRFLHPLGGGRADHGWMFGESVHLSQIASVIEGVDGVEHAENITLLVEGVIAGASVKVIPDALLATGAHQLVLRIGAR